jgi:hypothetical protein
MQQYFFDPKTGFKSATKLAHALPEASYKEINNFLSKQEVQQIHKPVRKATFRKIIGFYPGESLQADLIEMPDAVINHGTHYVLTVIDVYSRFAWGIALKNKTEAIVLNGFVMVLNQLGDKKVMNLQTDNGSEFKNHLFENFLKEKGIKHNTSFPGDHNVQGIIERFNRTIKNLISRYMTAYNTKNYVDVLQDLFHNYNNTYHNSLKTTPQMTFTTGAKDEETDDIPLKLKVNDKVRVVLNKGLFDKEGKSFSKGLYTVVEVRPNSYSIKNEAGVTLEKKYKENELQKINVVETNPFERPIQPEVHDVEKHLSQMRERISGVRPTRTYGDLTPVPRVTRSSDAKGREFTYSPKSK